MISFDGGATFSQELTPINAGSVKWTWTRRVDAGQLFKRKKLATELAFGGSDYNILYPYERQPSQRCVRLYIRQERECSGLWVTFWTGRFSGGSCRWDHSHCSLSILPETVDKYTCILDGANRKINILQAGPTEVQAVILPAIEFYGCPSIFATVYFCDDVWDGVTFQDEWTPGHSQGEIAGTQPYQYNVLWRERYVTECVAGAPVPPPGAGWVLLTNDCSVDGTATYVRPTTISWTFGDAVRGTMVMGYPTPPDDTCAWQFVGTVDEAFFDGLTPGLVVVPFFVCVEAGTPVVYERARSLEAAMNYILEKLGCGSTMRSDFFEINPPGDSDGYSAGINYVTAAANNVNKLFLLQMSDALDPLASQPATIGEVTFKQVVAWLRTMFRVYWDVDSAGNVRFEHYKHWSYSQTMDLTTGDGFRRNRSLCSYLHLSEQIPKVERAEFSTSQGRDFVGADILYDSPCATMEEPMIHSAEDLSTDITSTVSDPDLFDKRGFMMLACETMPGGLLQAIIGVGELSGNIVTNAPLSWANLQADFWTWDRPLRTGNMNRSDTIFDGTSETIEQVPLTERMCCDLLFWDGNGTVKTELGENFLLGRQGIVESAELDDATNVLTLTLRYAY